MILQEERELICEYGVKLLEADLTVGTFGNLSAYNKEENLMAISPSGLDYIGMKSKDVVILTPEGKKVDGDRKPSSEYDMHRIFYLKKPGIKSVIHTHSRFATTLACMNWSIPSLHYLVAYGGREIPCIPYLTFGTWELAEAAYRAMEESNVCLLGNHGLLAASETMAYTFDAAQQIEFVSELYYRTKTLGAPKLLSNDQIEMVLKSFKSYRTT